MVTPADSRPGYLAPGLTETRTLSPAHIEELAACGIDVTTACLAGIQSVGHDFAYGFGIRGDGNLDGLFYRYWEPAHGRFSKRFGRLKPNASVVGRKYLQPVGEPPRLYFVPGTALLDLHRTEIAVFITEGEKKSLALERARLERAIDALVIGIGGVWSWRTSPRELQPDGTLGKGKSRAIPDINLIRWCGRRVYLFFDTDVVTNWKVAAAETALAQELTSRGARVFIVRLPGASPWPK